MATKTLFWKDVVPSGATLHRSLQDGGAAPTTATTGTGWVANSNVLGQACLQNGGTKVARNAATWGTTLQPSAAPSQTVGDAWRSELPLDGVFANANWTLTFGIRSVTAAYAGRLKLAVRVWKSRDPNGANAVELTSGRVASAATSASLTTSADTTVAITWSPGGTVALRGEYLFVNVGIEITTAGSGTTQDVVFRVGSAYTIATSDFVPSPSSAGDDTNTSWFGTAAIVPIFALSAALSAFNLPLNTLQASPFVNALAPTVDASTTLQIKSDTSLGTPKTLTADTTQRRGSLPIARRESPPVLALRALDPRSSRAIYDPVAVTPPIVNVVTAERPQPPPVRFYVESRGSRAIYDSTDVTRGPLLITQRGAPPILALGDPGIEQSRALRDALVAAAPFANAPAFAIPLRSAIGADTTADSPLTLLSGLPPGTRAELTLSDWRRIVVDTSAKTPKTLTQDAQTPIGENAQIFAPDYTRPVSDTTRGTAKNLLTEPLPPGENSPVFTQDRSRPVSDTSAKTPKTLTLEALPIGETAQVFAPDRARPACDTSRGTAKNLFADAQLPVGRGSTYDVLERLRVAVDASRGTSFVLIPQIAPIANVLVFAPDRLRPIVDTSRGTAKSLFADAQRPVGENSQVFAPDRTRPVSDTSAGTAKTLFFDAQLPVGKTVLLPAQAPLRVVPDSTVGTAYGLLTLAPPVINAPSWVTPWRCIDVVDTSRGTPKTLTADAQRPTGENAQIFAPDGYRPVVDTSQSTPKALYSDVRPVGAPSQEPLARAIQLGADTSSSAPLALLNQPKPIGAASFEQIVRPLWIGSETTIGTPSVANVAPTVYATDLCYVAVSGGRHFIATIDREFLASSSGRLFLATSAGRMYLATAKGRQFLASADGRAFLAESSCEGHS